MADPVISFRNHVITLAEADNALYRALGRYLSFMSELKHLLINASPGGIDYLYGEPYNNPIIWVPVKDRVTLSVFAVDAAVSDAGSPFVVYTRRDFADEPRKWTFNLREELQLEWQAHALSQAKSRKRGLLVPLSGGKPDLGEASKIFVRVPHK